MMGHQAVNLWKGKAPNFVEKRGSSADLIVIRLAKWAKSPFALLIYWRAHNQG